MTTPSGSGPLAGLVIAPGSSYPKEGAVISELDRQAAAADWAVLRFDWSYTTYGGSASGNRKRETAELGAALEYLKHRPGVDSSRVVVAGKSLGSAVAYAVFANHPEVMAAVLLTPVFRNAEGAQRAYGGLADESRPVHLLTGRNDPLNNHAVMKAHLAGAGDHIVVTAVPGDHGLKVTRRKDGESEAANRANIEAAIAPVNQWLVTLLRP